MAAAPSGSLCLRCLFPNAVIRCCQHKRAAQTAQPRHGTSTGQFATTTGTGLGFCMHPLQIQTALDADKCIRDRP